MMKKINKFVALFCAFNAVAWSTPGYAQQVETDKTLTQERVADLEAKAAAKINQVTKKFRISTLDGHELNAADFISRAKAGGNEFKLVAQDLQIKFKSQLIEGTSQLSVMMEALDEKGESFLPNRFVQFTTDAKDSAAQFRMKAEDAARILAASFQKTSSAKKADGRIPASNEIITVDSNFADVVIVCASVGTALILMAVGFSGIVEGRGLGEKAFALTLLATGVGAMALLFSTYGAKP